MKNLSVIGLVLVMVGTALTNDAAQPAPGARTLSGHVPAAVSRLHSTGDLNADATLNLAIGLPLHNREALTNLLEDIYNPSSPNFHNYITPEQFTEQFGPDTNDYQKIIDFAQKNGFKVTGMHPNRMLLDVSGRAADIENAFHIKLHLYPHPTENRAFFAPDSEPSIDASLPILHVSGLDNYSLPHPASLKPRPTVGKSPLTGSAPGGAYMGTDFRNAYVPNSTLTGSGQSIGLLQFDAYYASDILAYETQIGLNTNTAPQLVIVPVDGGVATPTPVGNDEVSLDIEMILSMAPGVSKIYVYEEPNGDPWIDILNRMANDNLSKQLSSSWGQVSGPNPAAEQIFQQMALQGQTFFQASGDADAYTGVIPFPSDSPHITVVGGTTLTTGNSSGYVSETVWNWDIELGPAFDGSGSSGGISTSYSIPSWQTNINMTARGGSTTFRNIPDVALTADNVWVLFGSGQSGVFGGTSCAAPLWAGLTSLINQEAGLTSHAVVGFINPAIYSIATNSVLYTNCFHDIITGNNEWSGSTNLFMALTNYDLCTGLGTPNTNLIVTLSAMSTSLLHLSPPPAPYGTNFASLYGGNPNGSWNLFIQDDKSPNNGVISNGWILGLTTGGLVGQAADLALGMTASGTNLVVGGTVTYTIVVTNWGPSASSNVLVSDTLPLGATLIFTNATSGGFIRSGSTLVWTNSVLSTNAGAQLVFTLQAGAVGSFNNIATASSVTTADPNPDDDTVGLPLYVNAAQAPRFSSLTKGAGGGFQIAITNNAGVNTIIQASTNLVTTNWVNIYTGAPPFIFTDPGTNYPARYYRALIAP